MNIRHLLFVSLLILLMTSSCSTRKNIVYLHDMKMGENYPIDVKHEAVIHRDDRLSITVSCKKPELAIPFNVSTGSVTVSEDGNIRTGSVPSTREKGYRVDVDGYINFPILGRLYVEGLKVSEAQNLIRRKIIEGDYIKDPTVAIEFLNFKYTVLGAVSRNGTFTVDGDRITLLEAIANAGDLTSKARINRVAVIREEGNDRKMYMHDLRSTDIFSSPCFYLQQNDIVYVEPKYRKKDNEDRGFQIGTVLLSIASVITSIFWVLK